MLLTRVLFIILLVSVSTQMAAVGQLNSTSIPAITRMSLQRQVPSGMLTRSRTALPIAAESDSVLAKRTFFSTTITQRGNRLNRRSSIELLEDTPQAQANYRRGQLLKPLGPLLIASGLVIGYIAVKGTPKTAYARGIGTPANPSPPDVLVDYTSRNLPALVGGVGLLIGGLCLIELSNEMVAKSIRLYNAQVVPHRSVSGLQTIQLGITTSGGVGFEANF